MADTTRTRKLDAQRLGVVSSTSYGAEWGGWCQARPSGALFPLLGKRSRRSTHHVFRLQVPLQLLPEVLGAEFHCGSPTGSTSQRGQYPCSHPCHTASALTSTTSVEVSTSALTKASVNTALPPSCKPSFPTVSGFCTDHQSANQSLHKAPADANWYPQPAQQPGFCAPVWTP